MSCHCFHEDWIFFLGGGGILHSSKVTSEAKNIFVLKIQLSLVGVATTWSPQTALCGSMTPFNLFRNMFMSGRLDKTCILIVTIIVTFCNFSKQRGYCTYSPHPQLYLYNSLVRIQLLFQDHPVSFMGEQGFVSCFSLSVSHLESLLASGPSI